MSENEEANDTNLKIKSPPVPSASLKDCYEGAMKLFDTYTHGTFSKSEIASCLGMSASSGHFSGRLFSIKEFGLISSVGTDYKVSDLFLTLSSNPANSAAFKQSAMDAVRRADIFKDLLNQFPAKLPPQDSVVQRLINQKKFNSERAKTAANVLESSLRFAGVLDSSNNILPIRDGQQNGFTNANPRDSGQQNTRQADQNTRDQGDEAIEPQLKLEIAINGGRKVTIHYPQDLTKAEAEKVGKVLLAIVE